MEVVEAKVEAPVMTPAENPLDWIDDNQEQRYLMAMLLRIGHGIGSENYIREHPCSFIGENYFINGARQHAEVLMQHLREPDLKDVEAVERTVAYTLKDVKNFDPTITFKVNKVSVNRNDPEFLNYLLAASYRLCGIQYYHEALERDLESNRHMGPGAFKRAFLDEFYMIVEIVSDPVKNRRHVLAVINDVFKS